MLWDTDTLGGNATGVGPAPTADDGRTWAPEESLGTRPSRPGLDGLAEATAELARLSGLSDQHDELPAGTPVGDYVVEQLVAYGGMGRVYAASHPLIGKRVAIKVLHAGLACDRQWILRCLQEAVSVNQVRHPNIVDVISFGRLEDGRCYLIMEWLDGETLGARLQQRPLTLHESLNVLEQLAAALQAVHDRGIVHRDIKPDNVFLVSAPEPREQVKLLDFGIAKLGGQPPAGPRLTTPNLILGTPEYLSPEQAVGGPIDGRADIYSLGVMAYEMLLGELPFQANNVVDLLQKHMHVPPPMPHALWPEVPVALEQLLLGMLQKMPERRPSLAEVRDVLAEVSRVGPTVPVGERRVAPPRVDGAHRRDMPTRNLRGEARAGNREDGARALAATRRARDAVVPAERATQLAEGAVQPPERAAQPTVRTAWPGWPVERVDGPATPAVRPARPVARRWRGRLLVASALGLLFVGLPGLAPRLHQPADPGLSPRAASGKPATPSPPSEPAGPAAPQPTGPSGHAAPRAPCRTDRAGATAASCAQTSSPQTSSPQTSSPEASLATAPACRRRARAALSTGHAPAAALDTRGRLATR